MPLYENSYMHLGIWIRGKDLDVKVTKGPAQGTV